MSIDWILRASGPLPVNQLWGRASEPDDEILRDLKALKELGWIEVRDGSLPDTDAELQTNEAIIAITAKGRRNVPF